MKYIDFESHLYKALQIPNYGWGSSFISWWQFFLRYLSPFNYNFSNYLFLVTVLAVELGLFPSTSSSLSWIPYLCFSFLHLYLLCYEYSSVYDLWGLSCLLSPGRYIQVTAKPALGISWRKTHAFLRTPADHSVWVGIIISINSRFDIPFNVRFPCKQKKVSITGTGKISVS